MGKISIHTLRYGKADWLDRCAPTLNAWCRRHGLDLHTWTDETARLKGYPSAKFCEVDMLEAFLASDDEQMMYVDADVFVHPGAPFPEFGPGMHIRPHGRRQNNPFWIPWCREHFGTDPDNGGNYRNAGVWAIDRESARQLLSVIKPPYIEGIMEQNHFNWWIMLAERDGLQVCDLGREWNSFPKERQPAWMFHAYGTRKMALLGALERAGLIPRRDWPKTKLPMKSLFTRERRPLNLIVPREPWPESPPQPKWPMHMDEPHLDVLRSLLAKHRPHTAMEIGSHKGVSTQVFLDALDSGDIQRLIVVEPSPTPELLARIKACKHADKVELSVESSWQILRPVDMVLIDGDHRWPAFADLAQALALQVPLIAMHDTRSFSLGIKSCHGSEQAAEILRSAKGRTWFEDHEKRDGLFTERGFGYSLLSTQHPACNSREKTP